MTFPSITSWKDHFTKKSHCRIFQQSPTTIRDSISPSINVFDSIMEISKNPRITLLALDASEGNLQLFHHLTILRGNWVNKTEKIVATLGFENDASPIKLIDKSIKESKGKTPSISKFGKTMDNESKLRNLKNLKTDFHYMSIIPLPQLLMKTFMEL